MALNIVILSKEVYMMAVFLLIHEKAATVLSHFVGTRLPGLRVNGYILFLVHCSNRKSNVANVDQIYTPSIAWYGAVPMSKVFLIR